MVRKISVIEKVNAIVSELAESIKDLVIPSHYVVD
jgi:hypothetical protein